MTHSFFATASNRPRLRDPTHVQEAIGRYWFDWALAVGLERNDSGVYRLTIDGEAWPGSLARAGAPPLRGLRTRLPFATLRPSSPSSPS